MVQYRLRAKIRMSKTINLIGLDVGHIRIGVAVGDSAVCLAVPHDTLDVDGTEIEKIAEIVVRQNVEVIVVGLPRNQAGELTDQSLYSQNFAKKLEYMNAKVVFQDESLTSVLAEERLKSFKVPYKKADIDAEAASIILQDYIEENYA